MGVSIDKENVPNVPCGVESLLMFIRFGSGGWMVPNVPCGVESLVG